MVCRSHTHDSRILMSVSCPGGLARQYRVQYFEPTSSQWFMYATFGRRELAEQCLLRLTVNGFQARLVDYNISPAA